MTVGDTTRPHGADPARTVDVLEAGKALGITPDAVRAKLRRRTLEGFRDNHGRWRVVLPDTTTDTPSDIREAVATRRDTTPEELAGLQATVAELRARVESLEGERDRLLSILETGLREREREPSLLNSIRRTAAALADRVTGQPSKRDVE